MRVVPNPTGLIGVFAPSRAPDRFRRSGREPAWSDDRLALAGAPVWTAPEGDLILAGEVVLDPLERDPPATETAALKRFAGLFRRFGAGTGRYALGMYGLVAYERELQRLTLFRDGTGARTLYLAGRAGEWWFADRLSLLRRAPVVSSELSPAAIRAYLSLAYVPGALTMWRDARELRPGSTLQLPSEIFATYWSPAESSAPLGTTLEQCAAQLRPLLEEAVRCRLPESSPVGIYLSGGLDSSLVVALAKRLTTAPVHTYAIHFGAEHRNELEFSGMVAEACRTRHRVLELPVRDIQEALPATMAALDDPIGDPLTVPNLLLGRAAREEVAVVLNGEGGDPLFGGPKNLPMLLHELYGGEDGREEAYLRAYQKCYDELDELLSPEVRAALQAEPPLTALVSPYLRDPDTQHYLNRLMRINTCLKGADHILTKVSNLTRANGLLGRSPLFDRRLVDAAFGIPPEFKLSAAEEKAVLKLAAADLLPGPILTRPKSGMLVPVQTWFRRDLRRYAASRLLSRGSRIRPYLNQALIRRWLDYEGSLWPRHGVKLWLVLTLEEWLRVQP